MPEITRPSGLRLVLPETYGVAEAPPAAAPRRGSRGASSRFGAVPLPAAAVPAGENEALIAAMEKQEMELVDVVELEPQVEATPPTGLRRRGAPAVPETQSAGLHLDLQAGEEAVVLVEQDGVYSWVFPTAHEAIAAPAVRRGAGPAPAVKRVSFQIDVHASSNPDRRRDRRGFFTDLVFSKVKALVLKFAARIVVGQAMKFLERNVTHGLVVIDSLEPAKWRLVEDITAVTLPADRPARVLLLVHGTFSSTVGSYGGLAGTPWGRAFLEAALANYDAIIGFDHPTLGDDPLANAADLLTRLQRGAWAHPPQFHAVAYSRGALVFRSLVEHVLPAAKWPANFERAVFVGSTNGGTRLAEPDNWHALVDLYTNLAAGAARLLSLMPQAAPVAHVLSELVQGLGALIKYMATEAVTSGGVPGLAAMEPDGPFITQLNQTQLDQPTPDKTWYYAVTSEFKARVFSGGHEPKELPQRLVLALADGFVDQLMNAANDLVVDTASMTAIDPQVGHFVRDTFAFGSTPQVYHLNYFTRPEVTNALARWLQLAAPAAPATPHETMLERAPSGSAIPAAVDPDIMVTDVTTSVEEARATIEKKAPAYVVLRRRHGGETLNYGYATEDLLDKVSARQPEESLIDAIGLHEYQKSETRSISQTGSGAGPEVEVVLAGNDPVGVLPAKTDAPTSDQLVELAGRVANPQTARDNIIARRILPSLSRYMEASPRSAPAPSRTRMRGSRGGTTAPTAPSRAPAAAPTVVCHFRAEMDAEVVLKHTETIEVTVSREVIGGALHAGASEGSGEVDPTRKLYLQVIAKRNFEIVNEDRIEIDPPAPGAPQLLLFDVRATHDDGGEGELWVIARQGQIPLVTLTLRPRIATKRSAITARTGSRGTSAEAKPLRKPLTQLFIVERINGSEVRYHFTLQSPDLKILAEGKSEPIAGDRAQYVRTLYSEIENRWLSSNKDVDDFYAELRAYGGQLFDQLVPATVQAALRTHRAAIDSIMVLAEEPFIPWEIVCVTDAGGALSPGARFLGEMGLVRWLHEAGWPVEELRIRPGKARTVIPKYPHPDYELPETAVEEKFLRDTFGATPVEPHAGPLRKLLGSPGEFDLLHFAGHGEAEATDQANAALLLEGRLEGASYVREYFNATTAEYHSGFRQSGEPGPIIVLNACQIGRASYRLTDTGGFARAFLKRGASAFIGTLWSVGDQPACVFTQELYTQLRQNAPLAEATVAARQKAKAAGDATWLAYVVYGHPHARLS